MQFPVRIFIIYPVTKVMMILNSLQNNRFGLGGGTPQLHQYYGADIVSTGEVKANRLNPGCSVINKLKTEWR